jgi:hypothetical protein
MWSPYRDVIGMAAHACCCFDLRNAYPRGGCVGTAEDACCLPGAAGCLLPSLLLLDARSAVSVPAVCCLSAGPWTLALGGPATCDATALYSAPVEPSCLKHE